MPAKILPEILWIPVFSTKLTMGLTRTGVLLAVSLFFVQGVYAQTPGPGQLGAEIQSLEQKLSAGILPAERHDVLVRLAQLRQLSGNIAIAAVNWLDAAAAADPHDDAALVSGAFCLAATGEWEKAAAILRPLLASDKQGPSMLQARYLDACLKAWTTQDASTLAVLAGDFEFAALRPMIYYTLWQTIIRSPAVRGAANAELWKSRLLAEFPQSPEARAVDSEKNKDSPVISAVQSPLWLLFPGASDFTPVELPKPAAAPAEPPKSAVSAEQPKPAAPVKPAAPAVTGNASSGVVLQTGLFGKEANARAQSDALRKAGFTATVSRKLVNGTEYWAVTVPAGQNTNKTIQELKKAGFDSFPIK
jgi:cell division septation protein DedD